MNAFIVFAAVVAAASANPQVLLNNWNTAGVWPNTVALRAAPVVHQQIIAPVHAATKTQYHAQDELGQASYGYAYPGQSQAEVRDASGNVRGSYAYINPNGKEVRVAYTAGHGGFQVASNDLPLGPVTNPHHQLVANVVGPSPVQETPEVIQARAAHAIAHQEALARSGRKKRQAVFTTIPTTHALGYSNLINHPYAYNYNHLAYGHQAVAYSSPVVQAYSAAPVVQAYSAPVVSNVVAAAPQHVREATLTQVQNNPGFATSYRVD